MTLSDDHSKLPNKCYQVLRSEQDVGIELVEADTPSPTSRHEFLSLELSRALEPAHKERAWRNNLG